MSKKLKLPKNITEIDALLNQTYIKLKSGEQKDFSHVKKLKRQKARLLTEESVKGIENEKD